MNDCRHRPAGWHVVAGRRCRRWCIDRKAIREKRQIARAKGVTAAHGTGRRLAAVGRGGGAGLALTSPPEEDEDSEDDSDKHCAANDG